MYDASSIMMKVFYFGTPDLAVKPLEALAADNQVEIIGVGVMPDKKIGRKQILTLCPVKQAAETLKLPVFEIQNKQDLVKIFEDHTFDLGLVIAFGMIFPEEILEKPPFGVVNVHFSLLPKYRGASPVQSAILSGDEVSGITFQRMVKELDAGDILLQKPADIRSLKTSEAFEQFSCSTSGLIPLFLQLYKGKSLDPHPQKDDLATFCGKFTKADGEVSPTTETALEIWNKFRAFDLFPGIFIKTLKGNVKLTEVALEATENSHPITCKDDSMLHIIEAQIPGKKAMHIQEILKGNPELFD